jgi:hypothetical protein
VLLTGFAGKLGDCMNSASELSLFLDCSGPGVKIGLLCEAGWLHYQYSPVPALEAVSAEMEKLLKHTDTQWEAIRETIFCSGPGSQLGLRVGAISLQAWHTTSGMQLRTFALMPAAGFLLVQQHHRDFLLVAPARKGEWHRIQFQDGKPVSAASTVAITDIGWEQGIPAFWIPHRELGEDLPGPFQRWEPDWSTTSMEFWRQHHLLSEALPQNLLSHQSVSSYTRWDGQIHQKPASST